MKIINPDTGREIGVKTFDVDPKMVLQRFASGEWKSAKDLSWHLISNPRTLELIQETDGGEDSRTNFALSVMENALDWTLGLTAINFIRACATQFHKRPKPFRLGVSRDGEVYIILTSGRVLAPTA